jgi:DNA-binding GntR family transcriptional regulator
MRDYAETPSLAAEAYSVVRRRILRGELVLGQAISRRKLAAELGMSFLPVTEALLRLEVEGLLESRPRAGTRVRIPSHDDVVGHFTVREALEAQAAMLFARVATAAERSQLRKLAARVDAVATQPDRRLYTMLHHKLHARIAECARCPMLCDAIVKAHALASIWFLLLRKPGPDHPVRRHQELLDALTQGTPKEAAAAMRQHIVDGMAHTLEVLQPYLKARKADRGTFFRSERKRQLQGIVPPSETTEGPVVRRH